MSRKNGLIGGIRSTFWRRVALVLVQLLMLIALAPAYIKAFFPTLREALCVAWDAFSETFGDTYRQANTLIAESNRAVWSKDWKPVE